MTSGLSSYSTLVTPPSPHPPRWHEVFICRQPIYNRQLTVVAYAVLLQPEAAQGSQAYVATSQMLEHAFIDIGLQTIVGQTRAYVQLTRGFLLLDYASIFPPQRVILEIPPDTLVDAELLAALSALSRQGYTMALPDVLVYTHLQSLANMAEVIILDLAAHDPAAVQEHVAQLRPYAVQLLARRVDTPEDFALCRTLGIEYVQGYFFCQPDLVQGQRVSTNRLPLMQLLAELTHPEAEFEAIEAVIRRDVSLSYKLLRLINSSFFGLSGTITSIRQALLLLGMKQVISWASLMLLAGVDDKPHELTVTAMIRACMCDLLARAMQQKHTDTFFLVGLLSILDAVMDRPMQEILPALPLADEINRALLHHEGRCGAALHAVLAYEQGDCKPVKELGVDSSVITDTYLQAIAWAAEHATLLCPGVPGREHGRGGLTP